MANITTANLKPGRIGEAGGYAPTYEVSGVAEATILFGKGLAQARNTKQKVRTWDGIAAVGTDTATAAGVAGNVETAGNITVATLNAQLGDCSAGKTKSLVVKVGEVVTTVSFDANYSAGGAFANVGAVVSKIAITGATTTFATDTSTKIKITATAKEDKVTVLFNDAPAASGLVFVETVPVAPVTREFTGFALYTPQGTYASALNSPLLGYLVYDSVLVLKKGVVWLQESATAAAGYIGANFLIGDKLAVFADGMIGKQPTAPATNGKYAALVDGIVLDKVAEGGVNYYLCYVDVTTTPAIIQV